MSCNGRVEIRRHIAAVATMMLLPAAVLFLPGCGGGPGGGNAQDTDGGVLNFKGVATGVIADSRSTRESLDAADGVAQQVLPPDFDTSVVTLTIEDLAGEPLLDANGIPYPEASIDETGAFTVERLPVGVDFVIAADLQNDGETDIRHIIQIPADETGKAGRIENVVVDPLTTLVVARLRELLAENGGNLDELDISLTVVVQRIVDSFTHLFEESGIDQNLTLDDIRTLAADNVEELFDTILPAVVRTGINTVEGTLSLRQASEIEGVLRAAVEVFLRAGFPIVDGPGGIDLSFLGDLPDVEVVSFDLLFPSDGAVRLPPQFEELGLDEGQIADLIGDGTLEDLIASGTLDDLLAGGSLDDLLAGGTLDDVLANLTDAAGLLDALDGVSPDTIAPFELGVDHEQPVIYISSVTEPDRNFGVNDEFDPEAGGPHLPVLNERLLERMAKLHLEGRVITLRNLFRLLTDVDIGLGVRLTYVLPRPGHNGPPPMVFESADGNGVVRDVESVLRELFESRFTDRATDFDDLAAETSTIRATMRELLAGTVPPSMERLFGAILSDRIENVEQLFSFIRKAKAHLPFSRSGPSEFFVVADGDPFRPDAGAVNPISVDVEFGPEGLPARVVHNALHSGRFHLGFTHGTETNNRVELLVRETGRFFHGPRGERIVLNMGDTALFEPINGVPFPDFVSEEGTFWPGVPISVANPEFRLGHDVDDGSQTPTIQLFVLASAPGPNGEPVRVDFDLSTGMFSSSPTGRYYMMFLPETQEQGVFGLYDVELNFMAGVNDLTGDRFVEGPVFVPDEPVLAPPDEELTPPPDSELPPPDTTVSADEPPAVQELPGTSDAPPPTDVEPPPADTEVAPPTDDGLAPPTEPEPVHIFEPALVAAAEVIGLDIQPEFFRFVFGTEVPNERFDASGNPYFDDVNANGVEDPGEFTADFRPILFNADDWRSTDISRYYRRASGGGVLVDEIDFESREPRTLDGEALVPRHYLPRLNAFKFGRPNTAINLLTTFLPPGFFNGTQAFNADTQLGIFQALATINMVLEQVFNVEAVVDIDGDGPFEAQRILIDAHLFVLPIGDPLVLLLDGFETLSHRRAQ